MSWQDRRIGDLCTVGRGSSPRPINDQRYFENGEIPWIKVADATASGKYLYETKQQVNAFGASYSRLLPIGSLIICTSGTLGLPIFLGVEGCIHDGWLYTYDYAGLDPEFFYYFLLTRREYFFSLAYGAAIQNINTEILRNTIISLPLIDEQRKIAEVLKSYDDLIENNRRRMALLEDAARQLYREWFVRLRFPGHEHVKIRDGVPEGWERKRIAEICESLDYGYTASADKNEIGPKFLRITDIVPDYIDWESVPFCLIDENRLEKFLLHEGDIVVARTGATVGYAKRINKRYPNAVFASYLVRFRIKPEVDNLMVGTFIESVEYKKYVQSRIGGAAQPNANAKVLAGAEILIPASRIQRDFNEIVEPLIDQREMLQIQNQKLRLARDLLLPRLMSGQIPV
jgi:type I restriction enzyme S subunit